MSDMRTGAPSHLKEEMSILNWFTKNRSAPAALAAAGVESGIADGPPSPPVITGTNRKTVRLERRQLLYSVVRDAMISAGVLAASYKFKVLSLDAAGRQYLVMMDLADKVASDTARLAEIEDLMVQSAKLRHDILVTAVYWRVNDHVSEGLLSSQATPLSKMSRTAPESKTARSPDSLMLTQNRASHYEPLQQDEVAAFKRALASASASVPLSTSGKIVTSGRRNPAPPEEFEDTQMADPDERASPLGVTQYGDLR